MTHQGCCSLRVLGKVQAIGVLTEAQACLFAMEMAWEQGYSSTVIEGDCLNLVSKLKKRCCPNNELGLLIYDILAFTCRFDLCSFVHVKRTRNRVGRIFVTVSVLVEWNSRLFKKKINLMFLYKK